MVLTYGILISTKMTRETWEVRSDKRKPKMAAMSALVAIAAMTASIYIQISKRKSMYDRVSVQPFI